MVVAKSYVFPKNGEGTHPGVQEAKTEALTAVNNPKAWPLLTSCRVSQPALGAPQTRAKPHVQALPGPHGNSHLPLHGTSRYKNKLVSLSNHCQKQRTFYQSKVVADALVLTRPKRDICQVVLRSFPLR